ncbi:MAG: hypothetical protein ACYC41_13410 [Bacillota bacterium]
MSRKVKAAVWAVSLAAGIAGLGLLLEAKRVAVPGPLRVVLGLGLVLSGGVLGLAAVMGAGFLIFLVYYLLGERPLEKERERLRRKS